VRGHRVANANGEANVIADALQIEPVYVAPAVAAPMLIILLILLFVMTSEPFRKKGRKD
jgi:sortase A